MMKIASIALLLAAAVSASMDDPGAGDNPMDMEDICQDKFAALQSTCEDAGADSECFNECMTSKGMEPDKMDQQECDDLTGALCACGNQCSNKHECKDKTFAMLECVMEMRNINCPGSCLSERSDLKGPAVS